MPFAALARLDATCWSAEPEDRWFTEKPEVAPSQGGGAAPAQAAVWPDAALR